MLDSLSYYSKEPQRNSLSLGAGYGRDILFIRAVQPKREKNTDPFLQEKLTLKHQLFLTDVESPTSLVSLWKGLWPQWTPLSKRIRNTKLFKNVTHGNQPYPHTTGVSSVSGLQTHSPRLRHNPGLTSSYEIAKIMMLSLALIQSGKILISVQYPGKSHHAEKKKKL